MSHSFGFWIAAFGLRSFQVGLDVTFVFVGLPVRRKGNVVWGSWTETGWELADIDE